MSDPPKPPGGASPDHAASETFVLELPSELRYVEQTVAYLVNCCREHFVSESRLSLNFRVGVTEALANAILYGNDRDPDKRVRVAVELTQQAVVVEVTDEGTGFDPGSVPDPTLPENLDRTGGRGVFLIRQLMDEVEYRDGGNCVRLVLYRHSPPRRAAAT
jgi:serine/threonine-protein kinase RsbW